MLGGLAIDRSVVGEGDVAAGGVVVCRVGVDREVRLQRGGTIEADAVAGCLNRQQRGSVEEDAGAGDDVGPDADVDRTVGVEDVDRSRCAAADCLGVGFAEGDSAVGLRDRQRAQRLSGTEVFVEEDAGDADVEGEVVVLGRLAVDRRVVGERDAAAGGVVVGRVGVDRDVDLQLDGAVEADAVARRRDREQVRRAAVEDDVCRRGIAVGDRAEAAEVDHVVCGDDIDRSR